MTGDVDSRGIRAELKLKREAQGSEEESEQGHGGLEQDKQNAQQYDTLRRQLQQEKALEVSSIARLGGS